MHQAERTTGTRSEDVVEHMIIGSTHSYLMIFTNKGRLYWLKIYHIPDAGTAGKGKNISGLINLQPDEAVKAFLPVAAFVPGKFIVMVTKQGVIKKCELTEFDNPLQRGIIDQYASERRVRSRVDAYVRIFERLLDMMSNANRGDALVEASLTSEWGRIYVMLAEAAGRIPPQK